MANFLTELFKIQKDGGINKAKYFLFEITVWNIDGKAVAYLANRDEGIKAFQP